MVKCIQVGQPRAEGRQLNAGNWGLTAELGRPNSRYPPPYLDHLAVTVPAVEPGDTAMMEAQGIYTDEDVFKLVS